MTATTTDGSTTALMRKAYARWAPVYDIVYDKLTEPAARAAVERRHGLRPAGARGRRRDRAVARLLPAPCRGPRHRPVGRHAAPGAGQGRPARPEPRQEPAGRGTCRQARLPGRELRRGDGAVHHHPGARAREGARRVRPGAQARRRDRPGQPFRPARRPARHGRGDGRAPLRQGHRLELVLQGRPGRGLGPARPGSWRWWSCQAALTPVGFFKLMRIRKRG